MNHLLLCIPINNYSKNWCQSENCCPTPVSCNKSYWLAFQFSTHVINALFLIGEGSSFIHKEIASQKSHKYVLYQSFYFVHLHHAQSLRMWVILLFLVFESWTFFLYSDVDPYGTGTFGINEKDGYCCGQKCECDGICEALGSTYRDSTVPACTGCQCEVVCLGHGKIMCPPFLMFFGGDPA